MSPKTDNENQIENRPETEARMAMSDMQTLYGLEIFNKTLKTRKVRAYASSPVSLFGFSMACFCVGLGNLEVIAFSQFPMTVFLVFGGVLQYIIGIFNWKKGDQKSMILSIMYGLYNISSLFWNLFSSFGWAPHYSARSNSFFNIMWTVFMIPIIVVSSRGSKVDCALNCIVFLGNAMNIALGFTGNKALQMVIGVDYMFISAFSFYLGFAVIINDVYGRTVLPLLVKGERCCK